MYRSYVCMILITVFLYFPVVASTSIFGLADDGTFAKIDLDTMDKTILRIDIFVGYDNNATYDPVNHRFCVNTYDNLLMIDTQTGAKETFGNVFGRNVSIEYDPEWNCLFGLVEDGTFAKYDLNTKTKAILRTDIFVGYDNHSTYDSLNHRFYVNTYDNLLMIDTQTGAKETFGEVFGRNVSIEYDPGWNCLFGLVEDGTFARYDLDTMTKTVLRTDVFVGYDNHSTYDPLNHRFYVNTYDNLLVIDTQTGAKEVFGNVFGRNVSIEYAVPEPITIMLFITGLFGLRKINRSKRK